MLTRENVAHFYSNFGYWFLLFIPLTIFGFFVTYFSITAPPQSGIVHLHFTLMGLWLLLIIIQPLLIRYRHVRLHRALGKVSYFLLPAIILSTWLMMRHSYETQHFALTADIEAGFTSLTLEQGKIQIASFLSIAFVYLGWLVIFYCLAMISRKNSSRHARWMIAASLTFLGPTLDRLLFYQFGIYEFGPKIPVEAAAFLIIDGILIFLIWKDYQKGKSLSPFILALFLYILLQIFHLTLAKTSQWANLVEVLLS